MSSDIQALADAMGAEATAPAASSPASSDAAAVSSPAEAGSEPPVTPPDGADSTSSSTSSDQVPWHQDKRWQRWRKEEGELRQVAQLYDESRQARDWYDAVIKHPAVYQGLQQLIDQHVVGKGAASPSPETDEFAEYDPDVAKHLRAAKEAAAQVQTLTEKLNAYEQEVHAHRNEAVLEDCFAQFCTQHKVADPADQKDLVDIAVGWLGRQLPGRDLRFITPEQAGQALEYAYGMVDRLYKRGRTTTPAPVVPPSGSRTGVATRQESWGSDADRVAEIARHL